MTWKNAMPSRRQRAEKNIAGQINQQCKTVCVQPAKNPQSNKSPLYSTHHIPQQLLRSNGDISKRTRQAIPHCQCPHAPHVNAGNISFNVPRSQRCSKTKAHDTRAHLKLLPTRRHCPKPTIAIHNNLSESVRTCPPESTRSTPKSSTHRSP